MQNYHQLSRQGYAIGVQGGVEFVIPQRFFTSFSMPLEPQSSSADIESTTAQTNLSGAQVILKALVEQGVDIVFGYPGGAVLPIYDALFQQNSIRHILVRHEQGAAHAAEGYARASGKVGVLLVTSGPGATNAVTGLTDALMDSIPIVCLCGQVPQTLIGTDAFQECDTTGITRSCTKHNYLVRRPDALARTVHEAFYIARSGRPGPVLIDIPKDVQFARAPYVSAEHICHRTYRPNREADLQTIEQSVQVLSRAKRPIIYAGGGIINSGDISSRELKKFVELTNFPITLTLMGLGAVPSSLPQFLGMLGMHGTLEANHAMHDCDVMLCIGARFDDRVTGRLDAFAPNAFKIHYDIDTSSINKIVKADIAMTADAGEALKKLNQQWQKADSNIKGKQKPHLDRWWKVIQSWRERDSLQFRNDSEIIKPQFAIKTLQKIIGKKPVRITTEVGQHQMWAAQHLKFEEPRRWMTSGGLGTMGYGLPAAIGAQLAFPNDIVVDIAGEASILMNIQELSTAVQHRLPVKIFIINNQYMGMVRQWQELLHGGRYSETYSESLPDFLKLADAYGVKGLRATKPQHLEKTIEDMLAHDGPVLADICVDPHENCFPMIPSGAAHNEMLLGEEDKKEISEAGKILV